MRLVLRWTGDIQGVTHLYPTVAGIGSSIPVTPKGIR